MKNFLPTAYLNQARADWLALNPFREFLPDWLNPSPRLMTPIALADLDHLRLRATVEDELNQARTDLGKFKTTRRQRRRIEHEIADYLEGHDLLPNVVQKMRCCRMSGHWGEHEQDGELSHVIAWDTKCGLTRLCPDEARVEQRRLVRRYKKPMMDWKYAHGSRRIQKGVITWPNVAPGDLAKMKRLMLIEFSRYLKKFPSIVGALVSQEDPLAARGDWNVHLNALLLVHGRLDWSEFRAGWHALTAKHFPECTARSFSMDLKPLPRFDDRALEKALVECIKYPVKHVTEKSNGKRQVQRYSDDDNAASERDDAREGSASRVEQSAEEGQERLSRLHLQQADGSRVDHLRFAPGMIDWPPDLFMEWWFAGQHFRRTRSYGVLFRIPKQEDRSREGITWRGRVWWDARARAYAVERADLGRVDLIQGDNSIARIASNGYFLSNRPPGAGPPRPHEEEKSCQTN
jgi:hypothetical protein